MQKNRLHAATLLVISQNVSRKVQQNKRSATVFSQIAEHFVRDNSLYYHVLTPFQAKRRTCSSGLKQSLLPFYLILLLLSLFDVSPARQTLFVRCNQGPVTSVLCQILATQNEDNIQSSNHGFFTTYNIDILGLKPLPNDANITTNISPNFFLHVGYCWGRLITFVVVYAPPHSTTPLQLRLINFQSKSRANFHEPRSGARNGLRNFPDY